MACSLSQVHLVIASQTGFSAPKELPAKAKNYRGSRRPTIERPATPFTTRTQLSSSAVEVAAGFPDNPTLDISPTRQLTRAGAKCRLDTDTAAVRNRSYPDSPSESTQQHANITPRCHFHRSRALLSLLAGGSSVLCCQLLRRGRFWGEEVQSRPRRLLRVSPPQERGDSRPPPGRYRSQFNVRPDADQIFQAARVRTLQDAYRKAEAASPRDNAPNAGQIRNLGLIGKDDVSKGVIDSS